jgi:chromosome segregation protein
MAAIGSSKAKLVATQQKEAVQAAAIRPLQDFAKVETVQDLRAAIAAADAYRAVDKRARDAHEAVRNISDGLPLEQVTQEVAGEDLTQLAALLEETGNALLEAETMRETHVAARTMAAEIFHHIAGQDDAAKAEASRQDALLVMGDAVDEYVGITLGAKLLKWAVDRDSKEKQEPLLKLASELFVRLTRGAYVKLSVDPEADPPVLIAHRADGTFVAIGGLSTGTEDQLFLALRLAALQQHLTSATPLPFLADDIFINWDKQRCGAGFEVLAELATKTQVIVLTHAEDLILVAQRATGGCAQIQVL